MVVLCFFCLAEGQQLTLDLVFSRDLAGVFEPKRALEPGALGEMGCCFSCHEGIVRFTCLHLLLMLLVLLLAFMRDNGACRGERVDVIVR